MALPVLSTADLSAAVIDFGMQFQDVWDNTPTWLDKYGSVLPMSSAQIRMPWQQVMKQMRAWEGNRKVNQMVANATVYTAQLFELTSGISRSDVEDDQLGLWMSVEPARFAREIKRQPEILLSRLLEQNPDTFDGLPFFSDAHPIDFSDPSSPATNSNVLLNLADDGYAGLTADAVNDLQAQLMMLQGPDLSPTNFFCSTLMVHPRLALRARQLAYGAFYPTSVGPGTGVVGSAGGAGPISNMMQGYVEVVVNPYLTDSNRWYLFCTNVGVSPLIWFERTAPEISYRVSPDDWNVFDQDLLLIGARRRAVPGLGLYYMAGCGTTEASVSSIAPPNPIQ